ncbi:hypothetical protein PtA15_7A826 [Puccinia triticina]|uniref:Uncharacterized protein n=1 Tax=Puccinia triticina TaxID=208348 RepID=A0ABY7CTJ5_9BASI|nr:uncharacterized protein PtA15_7A826 [Puccinia triticina]WAQ87095.1 hypothetical protein PtA15_7A826 [Puccinia triticina]WAR56952.1 hypothetical protein PtB15_7B805 [Puccinia triticina]
MAYTRPRNCHFCPRVQPHETSAQPGPGRCCALIVFLTGTLNAPLASTTITACCKLSYKQPILFLKYPDLSVYLTRRKLPLTADEGPIEPPQLMLDLIDPILAWRDPLKLVLVDGDGAAGDPASLGVAVLVAAAATSNGNPPSSLHHGIFSG